MGYAVCFQIFHDTAVPHNTNTYLLVDFKFFTRYLLVPRHSGREDGAAAATVAEAFGDIGIFERNGITQNLMKSGG